MRITEKTLMDTLALVNEQTTNKYILTRFNDSYHIEQELEHGTAQIVGGTAREIYKTLSAILRIAENTKPHTRAYKYHNKNGWSIGVKIDFARKTFATDLSISDFVDAEQVTKRRLSELMDLAIQSGYKRIERGSK